MVNTQTKKMKNKTASEAHESKMKIQNRPKLIKKKKIHPIPIKKRIYIFLNLYNFADVLIFCIDFTSIKISFIFSIKMPI